jgi:cyclophilin family peptidyl-prolyl cis-trans isomerase
VIEGMDVVDAMAKVKKGANDRPIKEVKIESAKVIV